MWINVDTSTQPTCLSSLRFRCHSIEVKLPYFFIIASGAYRFPAFLNVGNTCGFVVRYIRCRVGGVVEASLVTLFLRLIKHSSDAWAFLKHFLEVSECQKLALWSIIYLLSFGLPHLNICGLWILVKCRNRLALHRVEMCFIRFHFDLPSRGSAVKAATYAQNRLPGVTRDR